MRRGTRNIWSLIFGIVCFAILGWFVNVSQPDKPLSIGIVFLTIFLTVFFLSFFFLNHLRRSLFVSLGLTLLLALRAIGLRHPLYAILLGTSFLSIELSLRKR